MDWQTTTTFAITGFRSTGCFNRGNNTSCKNAETAIKTDGVNDQSSENKDAGLLQVPKSRLNTGYSCILNVSRSPRFKRRRRGHIMATIREEIYNEDTNRDGTAKTVPKELKRKQDEMVFALFGFVVPSVQEQQKCERGTHSQNLTCKNNNSQKGQAIKHDFTKSNHVLKVSSSDGEKGPLQTCERWTQVNRYLAKAKPFRLNSKSYNIMSKKCRKKMSKDITTENDSVDEEIGDDCVFEDSVDGGSPKCPTPPPRPNRHAARRHVSPSSDKQTGSGKHSRSSQDDEDEDDELDLEADESNVRSPSMRKRDAMMRRYNSTSALPVGTPHVDINKNHVNGNSFKDYNGSCRNNGGRAFSSSQDLYEPPCEEYSRQNLEDVDIVGESFEARFPWQRDISTQCDLPGHRGSVSSSGSGGSDGCFSVQHEQQTCNYVTNTERHAPSRSSSDVVRRRYSGYKQRRPRSMTSIETGFNDSDMYKSDTNINYSYRQGRTSSDPSVGSSLNRKRMPLMVTDDPGSVSDLESIMEVPHDSVFDSYRTRSLGSEASDTSEISANLRRLENARDAALLDVPTSSLTGDVTSGFLDVLPSPRVSPEMWRNVPDVVVNTERVSVNGDVIQERPLSNSWNGNLLSVPRKTARRLSSGSVNSGSDESDTDISPPITRRGRRSAIIDTKNFGDVSPTTLSPDVSPSNSCDEGDTGSNIAGRLRRRRSSLDVAMNVYPGDLLVQEHHKKLIKRNTISDFYAGRNGAPPGAISEESKKNRQSFSLLKLMKTRSKESLHLSDVLKELKPSEFKDNHLAAYKTLHWTDLIASTDKQPPDSPDLSAVERKRRESVWELFKSECVFLIDHLMVLKHCFLEPLKKVQVEGFLMYAEPSEIFSNLDELCYVSYTFCKDFISALLKDMSNTNFGSTDVLIKAFQRFSHHSKDGSVYHTYCLNYSNALSYLEKLRKNDDFCEFEKCCEQDARCNRLQLVDLLIGPMQHCTKLPLLLHNIQKYTEDPIEKAQIVESIQKLETSLNRLEEKMKWLKNFERVQEIQRHLIWPSMSDLDSRAFIPEYLRPKLSRQPCERLLACPSRQLVHEGSLTLTESTKSFDSYVFLFDDILLITKTKKPNRKKQSSSTDVLNSSGQPDNQMYNVHRQPIALDRLGIHNVPSHEATSNGLKHAFVLVQISRFQQVIDVFTLQAPTESVKGQWITAILDAKNVCLRGNESRGNSLKTEDRKSMPCGSRKGRHGKSLSIDAVFL